MNGLNEVKQLALEIKQAWDRWQETADASEMDALGAHIDQTIDTLLDAIDDCQPKGTESEQ